MPVRTDPQRISTVRTFVAANLNPDLQAALARVQDRLKTTRADVGWVRPENLHLTLKFLAQVEADRIGAIGEAVAAAATGCDPIRLVFQGLGAFPRPREARVVWIGLSHGTEALAALQARIEAGLELLGFAREARPFTAHLTLGRVRGPAHREQLARAIAEAPAETLGEMVLDRIELMKSNLNTGGARYSILQSFPLA
ncbi:2',5' RNA ligase family [Candidatus Methylomirabilis lanthanidiphila]|uniref:RNA 2',3'-cyclic phosphodiesterase n=1 Tax=Candidatus Methylomirabilis lanthanidiphila TaxID=2211376 RepID=A0A564ZML4_9BACT|nr:RNA 2',3'-cyclic phosphodiesterase [Candidatus Methylomirabilis lanthanidiphila]VUZ86443.1 2',5' RNA ligase family [Candidatus Methylomirabilis lanthanidiphila]